MNCEWTKENVVLYIYEELADDAKFAFEQHVRQCLGCRRELDTALEFKNGMAALPVKEISPSFLAANRMQLQESLEQAEQSRNIFSSFIFDASGWFHQVKLAPALTAALLIAGFAGGVGTTYKMMESKTAPAMVNNGSVPAATVPTEANIAGIESITPDPNSNQVSIKYNTLQPQTLRGPANDPYIQQLLLLGARSNRNSGVVLDSVGVLTRRTDDNKVREGLVEALHDKNPGVRLMVLDSLKGYVRDDVKVRDAVVETLVSDNNAGVRQAAIGLLDPVKADSSVRSVLTVLAARDPNKFIRDESKRYLASTPHLD
jgi:hypothetical protein